MYIQFDNIFSFNQNTTVPVSKYISAPYDSCNFVITRPSKIFPRYMTSPDYLTCKEVHQIHTIYANLFFAIIESLVGFLIRLLEWIHLKNVT